MLSGSFQIGRSALAAYQAAINITGQNIANVANPDYTRQTGRLSAELGGPVIGGVSPGGGVRLAQLQRHTDAALENRLRLSIGQQAASAAIYQSLARTEQMYGELSTTDVSTLLSEFFAAFSNLETNPTDISARDLVVGAADRLLNTIHRQRSGLVDQVRDLNEEATHLVETVNALGKELADLNVRIVTAENGGLTTASSLRDRRDQVLRQLSEYIDVTVREQRSGAINVYVGSEPLVQADRSRGLRIERTLRDGLEVAAVRFADNNSTVNLTGGRIAGLVAARDVFVHDQLTRFDQLAQALVYETNRIHANGVGLVGHQQILSEFAVGDPDVPLNDPARGAPFPVSNGTFLVKVRDTVTGATITRQIKVDLDGIGGNDTTLNSLATALNGVDGLSATVQGDGRLRLTADGGNEVWFSDDRSGVLAALGIGAFFKGQTADTIDVSSVIRSDVRRIATSLSGEPGDGLNAGNLARLAAPDSVSALLSGRAIQNFHLDMVGDLALSARGAALDAEASGAVYQGLRAQREAISGVSLDEEAINLSKFETAYQGAARFLRVVDEMTSEVLALI